MSEALATNLPLDHIRALFVQARALIFDVDGTLAETEEAHRQAFNTAFAGAGLDWRWDRDLYKKLLRVAGGKERIRAFDNSRQEQSPLLSDSEIAELHRTKTRLYAELISNGGCPLRPGIRALLDSARQRGQQLAIATTTSYDNIDVLLSSSLGKNWAQWFAAIAAGDEVPKKKPAPDVYLKVLSKLNLPARQCLAFEDSGIGLASAAGAGIPVLISRSAYFCDDDFSGAIYTVDDITELTDFPENGSEA
jgi:HAD superfamily hydrolase (TIGR01509 family)